MKKLRLPKFVLCLMLVLAPIGLSCSLVSRASAPATPGVEGSLTPRPLATAVKATMIQPTSAGGATQETAPGGKVYYIRMDGGSEVQCTGLANAAYPGSGTGQPCAWDHPFRALPPHGVPRIAGGDTLLIAAGAYMLGYGVPGAPEDCTPEYAPDCVLAPIPSGVDPTHPTRILGAGYDAGCQTPPQLWGTQRLNVILNLTDTSNVEINCLEITDHSSCVEFHTGGLACERDNYPYGDWAADGLYAEDSANVRLANLNIHGLANTGIRAGRLTNWTVENVRLAGNGSAGWDGDLADEDDSNTGVLTFRHWVVEWNGCGETYPGGQPAGCWDQNVGGYGDGVGTGTTGGDWIIEDSYFLHNASDGLDLLYHTLGGKIVIKRTRSEGNAGNAIKVAGQTEISNSVLVGNCGFFDGQPFTFNVDPCRAGGNTLKLAFTGGEQMRLINSTFYGQGDGLLDASPRADFQCNGSETVTSLNNIFLGDQEYLTPDDITFLFYQEGCGSLHLQGDYNLAFNVKDTEAPNVDPPYPSAHNLLVDPQLNGPLSGLAFGLVPLHGSPAIDAGDNGACPIDDLSGAYRPADGNGDGQAVCDLGAYEVQVLNQVYLTVVFKD
jgi:hypothetical protein